MATYTGPDEYPIKEIPATPEWSENFAAMYAEPDSRVAVYYSIGRWHSDPTIWRESIMVSLPDNRTLYHRGYARNGTPTGPSGGLTRYEIIEPGQSTRLTFDGPMMESDPRRLIDKGVVVGPTQRVTLDLTFHSAAPLWNMKGDSTEAQLMAGSIHIDHIGTVKGDIKCGGKTFNFTKGYSVRDHSRGVRNVSQYGGHDWLNGIFPDGRAFYIYAMRSKGSGEIGMSNAAITQDGKMYPAKIKHIEFASGASDLAKTHRIVLESELGPMEIEVSEVLNSFVAGMVHPYDVAAGNMTADISYLMFDESVRMRWNGKQGIGWSERGCP